MNTVFVDSVLNTEVICALITFVGIVFSGLLSWFVSRSTANKEIEKMEHTWEHEAIVSSDEEFARMSQAVGLYAATFNTVHQVEALKQISALRSKESGDLGVALDMLYITLKDTSHSQADVDLQLAQVIDKKRKAKSRCNRSGKNKKNK